MLNGSVHAISTSPEGPDAMQQTGFIFPPPLYYASILGMEGVVQMLLRRGDDPEKIAGFCGTPLQAAALSGHLLIVRDLLESGAATNTVAGHYGTALQAAARGGHLKIAQLLLGYDADQDMNTASGSYGTPLQAAAICGHAEIVQLLIEYGAEVNAEGGMYGCALTAAAHGNHYAVVAMLLEEGADITACETEDGHTALYAACALGHIEVAGLLLDRGADPNAEGGKYGSALKVAAREGHMDVVRRLVRSGADIHPVSHVQRQHIGGSALHMAVVGGHVEVTRFLLDRHSVSIHLGDDEGFTPLMKACNLGNMSMVQLLLGSGANVKAISRNGMTALMLAVDGGNEEILRLLLQRGAEVGIKDSIGQTALDLSKKKGYDAIGQLLTHGVDASAANETARVEEVAYDPSNGGVIQPRHPNNHDPIKQSVEIERTMKTVSELLESQSTQDVPERLRSSLYTLITSMYSQLQDLKFSQAKRNPVGFQHPNYVYPSVQGGETRSIRNTEQSDFRAPGRPTAGPRDSSPTDDDMPDDYRGLNLFLHRASTS